MVPLIPYKYVTIYSSLSVDEAKATLAAAVSPRRSWSRTPASSDREFEGSLTGDKFHINRAIRYRNSFLPILSGRFTPRENGVQIDLCMTLHPLVIAFSTFWCSVVGPIALATVAQWLRSGYAGTSPLPVLLLAGYYLMVMVGYGWEAWQAEDFVYRLWPRASLTDVTYAPAADHPEARQR